MKTLTPTSTLGTPITTTCPSQLRSMSQPHPTALANSDPNWTPQRCMTRASARCALTTYATHDRRPGTHARRSTPNISPKLSPVPPPPTRPAPTPAVGTARHAFRRQHAPSRTRGLLSCQVCTSSSHIAALHAVMALSLSGRAILPQATTHATAQHRDARAERHLLVQHAFLHYVLDTHHPHHAPRAPSSRPRTIHLTQPNEPLTLATPNSSSTCSTRLRHDPPHLHWVSSRSTAPPPFRYHMPNISTHSTLQLGVEGNEQGHFSIPT